MFSKKRIKVEIQMVGGEFSPNVNTLTFENLPIEANISVVTLPSGGNAKVKIYGVSKDHMRMMTTIKWKKPFITQKAIMIYADDGEGYKLLFEGNIMDALPRYESAPDVFIEITATMGAYHNIMEVPPFHCSDGVPTSDVFRDMCAAYGVNFINHGVTGNVKAQHFEQNGLANRLRAASKAFNVYVIYNNNSVEIYPEYSGVAKKWNFTKQSYVGYPTITETGIKIKLDTIYSVGLRDYFTINGSEVEPANGSWKIIKYSYNLSTKIGGKWFMQIDGVRVEL